MERHCYGFRSSSGSLAIFGELSQKQLLAFEAKAAYLNQVTGTNPSQAHFA